MSDVPINITLNGEEKNFANYQEMVNYLAKNRINYTFSNNVIEHSIMLISKFIENINGTLKLYTKTFESDVFGSNELISNIKRFLEKNDKNKIEILTEEPCKDFIKELKVALKNNRITIKKTETKCQERYMVLGTAYRLALNNEDSEDFAASVNFNDKKNSEILNDHFDKSFKLAERLLLTS